MEALTLEAGDLKYVPDYPEPIPRAGEALVRVRLAGICTTDLEMVKGYVAGFSGVLGHEFVGEVLVSPDAYWPGRRVVASINIGCRQCEICRQDGPEHCPQRSVIGIHNRDGAFAERIAVPVANLCEVPDNVTDETAVFTEPLAAALRIREQVRVQPSAKIGVVGPGRLGLLVGQVLALGGTAVTMIGRRPASLNLPAQWGLATALNADLADNSFDLVVEATGNNAGFAEALRLVRPQGTLVLKSTFVGNSDLDLTKLVVGELQVVGSRCGPFAPALRLLAAGAVDVLSLVDGEFPFVDGAKAFATAAGSGMRKILLSPP